jgi:DNA polymerase III delta prime subunit
MTETVMNLDQLNATSAGSNFAREPPFMTIAIVGPQKYDFQDFVCIEMMLRFYDRVGMQFFVEPTNREDALLVFSDVPHPLWVEIQVKGAKGDVTLDTVAECLAHFPDRSSSNSLFERLVESPNRFVVLVMSGRCNDAASIYRSSLKWEGIPHSASTVKVRDAAALLKAIAALEPGKDANELERQRVTHMKSVAMAAKSTAVRNALLRLIVIEQVDDGMLTSECENLLRKRHRIPSDRTGDVITSLRVPVKSAKISQSDALVEFRCVLERLMPNNFRPSDYVMRGNEHEWVNTLSGTNVLLLSGPPRVGKTNAAHWIAAEFQEMGYEVKVCFDIDSAERFLLESVHINRLALLDDPLGGAHPVTNPTRALSRLNALIPQLGRNRKLIVAQAQDRLLAEFRTNNLSDACIANLPWQDLGKHSSHFLSELWRQLQQRYKISEPLFAMVAQALLTGTELEAGCILHLAVHHHRLSDQTNLVSAIRLAREDANDLGKSLATEGFKQILMSLAISTGPGQPVAKQELAFVLGFGGDIPLSVSIIKGSKFVIGGDDEPQIPMPAYDLSLQLPISDEEILEKLELRRIVELSDQEAVSFTHPFYRSAAEILVDSATRLSETFIGSLLKRGIFCLSPRTSRASARNMDWIHGRLKSDSAKTFIVDLAISGLDSIYPSTRDICFEFLLRQLPDLPLVLQQKLPHWVNQVTTISLSTVQWIDGEAWLPKADDFGLVPYGMPWHSRDETTVATELLQLDGHIASKLTPERAWAALEFYEHSPGRMTVSSISRLLSFDEALIRAQAVEIWLSLPRSNDNLIMDRVFMEAHPAIALAALKGTIVAWNDCGDLRQISLLDGLSKFAALPAAAAAMIADLIVFGRVEYTGDETPWAIFEATMPEVLKALPVGVAFNDGRLFSAIEKASSHLSVVSMLRIFDSWIRLLERTAVIRIPSDYELGITQILMQVTKGCKGLRTGFVAKLLSLHGTGATLRVVADLVDDWQELTDEERNVVISTLDESRIDGLWLRAIVITRPEVPKALEQKILPAGVSLIDNALTFVQSMTPQLLDAAVKVYTGSPQPLWYIGTHHSGKAVWESVMEQIALDPTHPNFDNAWEHITSEGDGKRVGLIVSTVGLSHADRMLELLMRNKLKTNGNFMPEAWDALLSLAPDAATRADWIKLMAAHASVVLDDLGDAKRWLSGENLTAFAEHLINDINLLKIVIAVEDFSITLDASGVRGGFLKLVLILFEKNPPLLSRTCDSITTRMTRMGYTNEELLAIKHCRQLILEKKFTEQKLVAADEINCWVH